MRIPQNRDHNNISATSAETEAPEYDSSYEKALVRVTAAPFATIPSAAIIDRRLSTATLRVFTIMCWHANAAYLCWASQATIADELGIERSVVAKHQQKLVELGYLALQAKGKRMYGRGNTYRVIFAPTPVCALDAQSEHPVCASSAHKQYQ